MGWKPSQSVFVAKARDRVVGVVEYFVNSFSVQAYESERFLSRCFDDKAKRDAILFKSLPESKRQEMLKIVRSQLVKQIESESQGRLENLWEGSQLFRQDLMELQEDLSKNRMRIRIEPHRS
jgi:hypothetical protein